LLASGADALAVLDADGAPRGTIGFAELRAALRGG
jgi:hypothetical protein